MHRCRQRINIQYLCPECKIDDFLLLIQKLMSSLLAARVIVSLVLCRSVRGPWIEVAGFFFTLLPFHIYNDTKRLWGFRLFLVVALIWLPFGCSSYHMLFCWFLFLVYEGCKGIIWKEDRKKYIFISILSHLEFLHELKHGIVAPVKVPPMSQTDLLENY